MLVERDPGVKLLVVECDAQDTTQQWELDLTAKQSLLKNPSSGLCVTTHDSKNLMTGSCTDTNGSHAIELSWNATTKQLHTVWWSGQKCLDDSNPDVGLFACHGTEDGSLSHQQWSYDSQTKLLKSLSDSLQTPRCVGVRANPGRTHPSTQLQGKGQSHVAQFAEVKSQAIEKSTIALSFLSLIACIPRGWIWIRLVAWSWM